MMKKLIPAAVGIAFCMGVGAANADANPTVLTTAQLDNVTGAGYDRGGEKDYSRRQNGGDSRQKNQNKTFQVGVAALNNVSVLSGNGILGSGQANQDFSQNKNVTLQSNRNR